MSFPQMKPFFAGLLLGGIASTVHADIQWDWTYAGANTGTGTFTTGNTETTSGISGQTGYLVTGMTGIFDSAYAVSVLGSPGNSVGRTVPQADNLLIPTGGDTAQVTGHGLVFYLPSFSNEYQFINNGANVGLADQYYAGQYDTGTLTITEVPVAAPEPSSLIGGAAVLAIFGVARARKYLASRQTA